MLLLLLVRHLDLRHRWPIFVTTTATATGTTGTKEPLSVAGSHVLDAVASRLAPFNALPPSCAYGGGAELVRSLVAAVVAC